MNAISGGVTCMVPGDAGGKANILSAQVFQTCMILDATLLLKAKKLTLRRLILCDMKTLFVVLYTIVVSFNRILVVISS